ncbi:hypothetical protein K443DRAFT_683973 [Laccaria amethystina LaAM-08-1]|uniref:F-box domain-containing protein n=1 Tax=Laccaria amethystina LaAM-08-1 TaxID=1095629 RepID=A0A0C9X941_9AGAR|nr:hypothetical protein K443DRAFT_683973 [Laccaria amethystina LaAM-08-1]
MTKRSKTPNPTPTTHRVLCIPELLTMIFRFLSRESNAENARVCRRWSDIALDALWRVVDDPPRLFGLLAPLRKNAEEPHEYEFERTPDSNDWKRFDRYSTRVRHFTYQATHHPIHQSLFDAMARTRTRLDILPNMNTLSWNAPLSLSIMFMHRGVKHFVVVIPTDVEVAPFFQDIAARMPDLCHLDLRSRLPVRNIEENTCILLSCLTKLQKITFPRFYFTTRVTESLSRLDALGVVEFQYHDEQGVGSPEDVADFCPTLTEGAFPALWDFSLNVDFEDAALFVTAEYAPANLTMLYIDSEEIESPADVQALINAVADHCPHLKLLALVSQRNARTQSPPPSEDRCIDYGTLKPLLRCRNLTSLEIVHQFPLSLKQEDLERLAVAWRALEKLTLNNEPVHMTQSNLTLHALLPFAEHCRQLTHLGIFIDASHDIPTCPFPVHSTSLSLSTSKPTTGYTPFRSLHRLSMGVSIIKPHPAPTAPVALYLSQLLPLHCKLDCGITWNEDPATEVDPDAMEGGVGVMDVGIAEMIAERCEAWGEVAGVLPMLTQLRMEERGRMGVLEREVEDLRMRVGVVEGRAKVGVHVEDGCVTI